MLLHSGQQTSHKELSSFPAEIHLSPHKNTPLIWVTAAHNTHGRKQNFSQNWSWINTKSQSLRIGNCYVVGRRTMALAVSKEVTFKELFTAADTDSQSCTASQHCFVTLCHPQSLPTGHTGSHCQLRLLVQLSPTLTLLSACSLILSLKLKFEIHISSPFPKPARLFIAASWQHFVRDGSWVLECLNAVFQTPDVSPTLYHTEADEDSGAFQGHLCSCTWTLKACLETGHTQSFGKMQAWTPKPPLFAASLPQY